MDNDFIPIKSNYDKLLAYQKAECIYDVTFHFAKRFLDRGNRTVDQMIQAARSGKQNIAGGDRSRRHLDGNRNKTRQCGKSEPARTFD